MESIYRKPYTVSTTMTDAFGRLSLSRLMGMVQEAAVDHSNLLGTGREDLLKKGLFWAVIRHKVQITRLPRLGESVTLETWPMPTTRTAYPRAAVALDEQGRELFRSVSLWVLMNPDSRAMILPGKSGVTVEGLLRGTELSVPGSIIPGDMDQTEKRAVRFSELDMNGHMNNCRYLDWAADLLSADFHREHTPREFTLCYLSEAREGQKLELHWSLDQGSVLRLDIHREKDESITGHSRLFAAQILF